MGGSQDPPPLPHGEGLAECTNSNIKNRHLSLYEFENMIFFRNARGVYLVGGDLGGDETNSLPTPIDRIQIPIAR